MSLPTSWDTKTEVPKSQADIIAVLDRFGCSEYGFRKFETGEVAVMFKHDNIPICIKVDPKRLAARALKEKPYTTRSRCTRAEYAEKVKVQSERVTYRNLHDTLKVMLNQAESDLIDFKTLMLPFIMVGDSVIADRIMGNIDGILSGLIALPAAPEDPYEVLGVKRGDTLEEIEDKYGKLAKRYHPDKPNGSDEKMTRINLAIQKIREEYRA